MNTTLIPENASTRRNMDTPFIPGNASTRRNMDTPFTPGNASTVQGPPVTSQSYFYGRVYY